MPTLKTPKVIERFSTPGIYQDISVWVTRNLDFLSLNGYKEQLEGFISTEELLEPFKKVLEHQSLQIHPAFYGLNRVLREEIQKRRNKITQLKTFQTPVKIIFGNDDIYLNSGVDKELLQLFPNSKLHLIENAGHFFKIEKPEQVAYLLHNFPLSETQ